MGAPRLAAATASPRRALADVLERVSESVEKRGSLGKGWSEESGEWKAETDLTLELGMSSCFTVSLEVELLGVSSSAWPLLANRGREKFTTGLREVSGLSVPAMAIVIQSRSNRDKSPRSTIFVAHGWIGQHDALRIAQHIDWHSHHPAVRHSLYLDSRNNNEMKHDIAYQGRCRLCDATFAWREL